MTAQPIGPASSLDVSVDLDHAPPAIRRVGALDYEAQRPLTEAAERMVAATRPGDRVVLDLAGVTFCDIAGLRALESVGAALGDQARELAVLHPSRAVMRLVSQPRAWVHESRRGSARPDLRRA